MWRGGGMRGSVGEEGGGVEKMRGIGHGIGGEEGGVKCWWGGGGG